MFPCEAIGIEVVTKGYALGEPVEVKVSGGWRRSLPKSFFPWWTIKASRECFSRPPNAEKVRARPTSREIDLVKERFRKRKNRTLMGSVCMAVLFDAAQGQSVCHACCVGRALSPWVGSR